MILERIAEHEQIVEITMDEITYVIAEDVRHQTLESSRGVAVTLLHHETKKSAKDCRKGHLVHVLWFYSDLFVGVGQVDFQLVLRSRCPV